MKEFKGIKKAVGGTYPKLFRGTTMKTEQQKTFDPWYWGKWGDAVMGALMVVIPISLFLGSIGIVALLK